MWFRDICFACDGSSTTRVFPLPVIEGWGQFDDSYSVPSVTTESIEFIYVIRVGNGISFRKKFRGIDSERFPLFRGRKCSFRGIPSSSEEPVPKLGTKLNGTEFRGKKILLLLST